MKRLLTVSRVMCLICVPSFNLLSQSTKGSAALMSDGDYSVASGPARMSVDPRVGGTIDSLLFEGYEFLTGKDVHPFFYGSTFWPSPQSDWNWPPPPVLNVDPYAASVDGDTLTLVSGKDEITGFQFTKKFFPGKGGRLELRYTISNVSGAAKKVAPWEITRVRKGGLLFFPVGNNRLSKKSFGPVPVEVMDGVAWYKDPKEKPADNLLTSADGTEGWAAYAIDRKLFVKKFPNVRRDELAPGEGEITIYVSGVADYVEFEVQGKYEALGPGNGSSWQVTWIVADIPQSVASKVGNKELVEFARKLVK
jgi:Domain of unknown function (DUF4380)